MAKGLIEQGWDGFRQSVVPANASAVQVVEMRKAFFAGAAHLFAQAMLRLDPGTEPTEEDLAMLDGVHAELLAFALSVRG
jgi:hypothetical protein